MIRTAALALAALLVAGPVLAQGSAPNQGVTAPQTPPPNASPAPAPSDLTDGTPRTDPGGSPTRTDGGTTAGIPLPSTANTNPADNQRRAPDAPAPSRPAP